MSVVVALFVAVKSGYPAGRGGWPPSVTAALSSPPSSALGPVKGPAPYTWPWWAGWLVVVLAVAEVVRVRHDRAAQARRAESEEAQPQGRG